MTNSMTISLLGQLLRATLALEAMQTSLKSRMRRIPRMGTIAVLGVGLCLSSNASATLYRCTTTEMFDWTGGIVKSMPDSTVKKQTTILFDDNTGILGGNTKFTIIQKMTDQSDLIAESVVTTDKGIIYDLLRIRAWDRSSGVVFLEISGSLLTSGRCGMSNKAAP